MTASADGATGLVATGAVRRHLTATALLRRVTRLVAISLGVAIVAVACSGDSSAGPADDATTTTEETVRSTTSTTSVEEARRQEVIDALEAADEAFDEAASIPDPDYPLEETHTEVMLVQRREVLESLAADGLVIEYPSDSQAATTVTSVRFETQDGEVAVLEECTVDDGRRVQQDTGQVVGGGGVSTVRSTAAMVREEGAWKLAELRQDERRDGVAECPVDG